MIAKQDVGRAVIGVAVLVLALGSTAYAQGLVRGKVTDKWNNPIPNVNVLAESLDDRRSDPPQETTTGDDGVYVVAGLYGREYAVTFRAAGYQAIRMRIRPSARVSISQTNATNRQDIELNALPPGGRLRDSQTFEADGGVPKLSFDNDGTFEFEDAEGEGEGTYGIIEQEGHLIVRDYDGDDDKYSITEPIIVTFTSEEFTSFDWGDATLVKK